MCPPHTRGGGETERGGQRTGLKGGRIVGTADENVGAETRGDRDLTCRTEIVTGEKAGARRRDAVREHAPHHTPAAGRTDIQPELADRAVVDLLRSRWLGRECAGDRLLRADDEAHAGRDVASQDTGPHALGGRWTGGRNSERQGCCPDGRTKHMDPPFA